MTFLETALSIVTTLFIFNVIFAIFVVFFERRNPVSSWAWLMVLLFIPVVGFIIYLIFGQDGKKQKMFIQKCNEDEQILEAYYNNNLKAKLEIQKQTTLFSSGQSLLKKSYLENPEIRNFEDLANMHIISNKTRVTYNNKVDVYHDGKQMLDSLINDIRNAKSYIHFEYYIIQNDKLGKILINELAAKAKQGVEVKLIYDYMGSRGISKKFLEPLTLAGGRTGVYLKNIVGRYGVRLNYRNHRKIAVIDGLTAYTGGFNIGMEYLGLSKKFGYWSDTHIRLQGDSVDELELRFIMDWNFIKSKDYIFSEKYFPTKEDISGASIQIVSSGPDSKFHQIKNGYFKMINEAEKSIHIVTPYFIPDDSIFEAVRVAALSGIDVKILIPGKADHPFVYWANLSYAGELIKDGVKFYHYDKSAFVHSKLIMIDGCVSSVGTANMDLRSFKVNFEVNSFIYDKEVTSCLEDMFNKDIEKSTELTVVKYNSRGSVVKILEAISRLISPML